MNENIEKIIKIQGIIDKRRYHLFIQTDLEKECKWLLFLFNPNKEDYLSGYNVPILDSRIDTIDDLVNYLEKHDGFSSRF